MNTRLIIFLTFTFAFVLDLNADSATWNLHPIGNDWNTSANWTPATVPNGPTDVATFASSSITDVTFSSEMTEVAAIVFDPGASSFNITADPEAARINVTLTISGAGITNNSGVTQNLTAAPTVRAVAATIEFLNAASADDNTVLTIFGSTTAARGGQINFHDTSTAGTSSIVAEGALTGNEAIGGQVFFDGNSTAGNASVTIDGALPARVCLWRQGDILRVLERKRRSLCHQLWDRGEWRSGHNGLPRLNFVVQHWLGLKEALIGCFVSMSFSRSVV